MSMKLRMLKMLLFYTIAFKLHCVPFLISCENDNELLPFTAKEEETIKQVRSTERHHIPKIRINTKTIKEYVNDKTDEVKKIVSLLNAIAELDQILTQKQPKNKNKIITKEDLICIEELVIEKIFALLFKDLKKNIESYHTEEKSGTEFNKSEQTQKPQLSLKLDKEAGSARRYQTKKTAEDLKKHREEVRARKEQQDKENQMKFEQILELSKKKLERAAINRKNHLQSIANRARRSQKQGNKRSRVEKAYDFSNTMSEKTANNEHEKLQSILSEAKIARNARNAKQMQLENNILKKTSDEGVQTLKESDDSIKKYNHATPYSCIGILDEIYKRKLVRTAKHEIALKFIIKFKDYIRLDISIFFDLTKAESKLLKEWKHFRNR